MATNAEVRGVVKALRGIVRRAGSTVRHRPTCRAVLALAELAFTQMGIPGAVACCDYLIGWWGTAEVGSRRLPPASATIAPDQERS